MNREAIERAVKLGEPGPTLMRVTAKGALGYLTCVRASHFSANEQHCSYRSRAVCSLRGVHARLEARGK